MMRAAVILLLLLLAPMHARAEARMALLIGNQTYNPNVGPLKNPHDDVVLVGAALKSLGFAVTEMTDADYRSMDAAIKRYAAAVRREGPGTISIFYYSGHGAADPDTKMNYLIPIDVAEADDADLWNLSLNLNNIVDGLRAQAPAATHYVIFDACRNELNLVRKGSKALTDKGFAPIAYTPGVMVAYATAPGKTAADTGSGGGSYAKALADELVKPGVEAMTMFRRVALRVNRDIGQDPWMSASTLPEVYFAGQPTAAVAGQSAAAPATAASLSEVAEAWAIARDANNIAALELFVGRFKDTYYAELGRLRILELKKNQQLAKIYSKVGYFACFSEAQYPDGWRGEANCTPYGCNFGKMPRDACLALGATKRSKTVIHGNTGTNQVSDCWLQHSCGSLKPHSGFTLFKM